MSDTVWSEVYAKNAMELGDHPRSVLWPSWDRADNLYSDWLSMVRLNDGDTILDVGCGTGRLKWWMDMSAVAVDVSGIEPVEELYAIAKKKMNDVRCGLFPAVVGEHERYSHVVLFGSMVTVERDDSVCAIREALRITSLGGTVAVTFNHADQYSGSLPSLTQSEAEGMLSEAGALGWELVLRESGQEMLFVVGVGQ